MKKNTLLKKVTAFLIAVVLSLTVLPCNTTKVYAENPIRTQQEAIDWIYSINGQYVDYDKSYGAQCVDLIYAYYDYLGYAGAHQWVNANGFIYNDSSKPSTWEKIKYYNGFVAQAGDIALFDYGYYGHIGLIMSGDSNGMTTLENNRSEGSGTTPATSGWRSYGDLNFWGVIRPKFLNASSEGYVNYATISAGDYYLKHNATGKYLSVDGGGDTNKQNISVAEFTGGNEMKLAVSGASRGYIMRPHCSGSRVVNPYGTTVTSGMNVSLWPDENDSTQWWGFEEVSSGYIIRNMQNQSCVLAVDGTNVVTAYYTGDANQIWSLDSNVVSTGTNGIQEKLDELRSVYYTGTYFTASGNAAHYESWESHINNIPARGGLPAGNTMGLDGTSCWAFAQYCFVYMFGHNFYSAETVSSPSLGDAITLNDGAHYAIYLGEDSENYYVYDGNYDYYCVVRYNGVLPKSSWHISAIHHSQKYDEVYGTKTPTTVFTVTYDANGGVGAPTSQTKKDNESIILSSCIPTRTGYKFVGWGTSNAATSSSYQAGDVYSANENITLYAIWISVVESPVADFKYTITGGQVTITDYLGDDAEVEIPAKIEGCPVTSIGNSAFKDCYSLINITITNGLKSIGTSAFYNCNMLTSITIPNSVTSIGGSAFSYCTSLTSITLPDSVTSIGISAFEYCYSLTKINIPEKVTSIGNSTFLNCNSLISVAISSNVTSIGSSAFQNCSSLTKVVIPNEVINIGSSAFRGCSSLTSIIIPDSVVDIGDSLFDGCSSLVSVTLSNNVMKIGNYTFNGCESLTSITIPNSVTSIGTSAFYNCNMLTSITIPNSVTSIGNSTFSYCTSLTNITLPDSVTSIGTSAFSCCYSLTQINIPEKVTSIGISTFAYCESLTSITLSDSVTSIGNSAFSYCTSLTSITLPDSVKSIGSYAFSCCNSLISIIISDNVVKVGDYTFQGCKSLTKVIIPNSVTSIGGSAFYGCSSLTSIIIPDSVVNMGNSVFDGCSSLTSIIIPDSVVNMGNSVFDGCSSLVGITLSNNVMKMGDYTFRGCESLTKITVPNGVTSIGGSAFNGCSSLTSIIIPDSVVNMGNSVFDGCTSLVSVTLSNNVMKIGDYTFRGCESLTKITVPNGVTSIGGSAFNGCSSLTSIMLPDSVTSIGSYAFYNCNMLTSVTIPNSVTSIGSSAFYWCDSLSRITIPNSVMSIGEWAFAYCNSLTSITLPNSITSISNALFAYSSSLTSVMIPDSIISIDTSVFYKCNNLKNIYYTGTEVEWDAININTYSNDALLNATIFFNCVPGEAVDMGTDFIAQIITDDNKQVLGVSGIKGALVQPNENNRGQLYYFVRQADGSYKIIHARTSYILGWQDEANAGSGINLVPEALNNCTWIVQFESGKCVLKASCTESLVVGISNGSVQLVELTTATMPMVLTVNRIGDVDYEVPTTAENGVLTDAEISTINNLLCEVSDDCKNMGIAELNQKISEYASKSFELGVVETKAIALCINILSIGGDAELERVLTKTNDYSIEGIYAALLTDTGTQVGAYRTRNWIFYKSCVSAE